MGTRNLGRIHSSLSFGKEDRQGCLWGLLHVLHFHQWHNVKKMLPYKRVTARNVKGHKYSRLKTSVHGIDEAQESIDPEMDDPRIVEKMSDSPTSRKSGKVRKKKLIADEAPNKHDQKDPSSPSRFFRTDSIHHLQPSHPNLPDEVREDNKSVELHRDDVNSPPSGAWGLFLPPKHLDESSQCEVCATIISVNNLRHNYLNEAGRQFLDDALLQNNLDKATEALSKLNSMEAKELLKDDSLYQSKEFIDALEILSVNKKLLLKILQDPNYDLLHHFHTLQASNPNRALAKSGSFPVNNSSNRKNRHSRLKPMKKDIGFFEDYAVSIQKPGRGIPDVGQTSTGSTPVLLPELKKRGENRVVLNRFKNIRQKIKHALRDSKKEGRRISMDAFLHKVPYGRRISRDPKREIVDKWREVVMDGDGKMSPSSHGSDISALSPGNNGLGRMRRTHSLNESLDRYSQLFESSFSNEAKPNVSDKLKVTNEDGCSSCGSAPKTLARILSLPDLGSYYSLRGDVSGNVCSGKPTRVPGDSNADVASTNLNEQKSVGLPVNIENCAQLDAPIESGKQEESLEVGKSSGADQMGLILDPNGEGISTPADMVNDLHSLTNREGIVDSQHEQAIPISVLETSLQEDMSSPSKCSSTQGLESKSRLDELASSQGQTFVGLSSQDAGIRADLKNVKIPSKHSDIDFRHVQVNKKDEADFNYVRDVLKLSGFSGNEYLGTWHSPEQPVDPSLFEEVEACTPSKFNFSEDDAVSSYDHQLLFDIINEVLLDIYERSFFYCPRPLSCNCQIRPMPMGNHVLEEVWSSISWYLGSQPELEPSLDYVVARDLSRGDGWMNLQFDSECVGLELEEMILDDLLDEVIYS